MRKGRGTKYLFSSSDEHNEDEDYNELPKGEAIRGRLVPSPFPNFHDQLYAWGVG